VLQGFNSQLTMLDTRGGSGASADSSGDDFGSSGPSGGSSATRERKPAMAGAGKRDDMDDEIPF
jgi:single-strand DNA-binding protein